MKLQNKLWNLGFALAVIAIVFSIYQHYHKQYTQGHYTANKILYKSCLQAAAIAKADGDTLTLEEKKECDSLHKLIIDYETDR